MADLNNKKPSATFHSLLNVGTTDNQTLDGTLRTIEDGRGNDSALKLSTGAAQVDNIKIDGSFNVQSFIHIFKIQNFFLGLNVIPLIFS